MINRGHDVNEKAKSELKRAQLKEDETAKPARKARKRGNTPDPAISRKGGPRPSRGRGVQNGKGKLQVLIYQRQEGIWGKICALCGVFVPAAEAIAHAVTVHGHRLSQPKKSVWVSIISGGLPSLGRNRK